MKLTATIDEGLSLSVEHGRYDGDRWNFKWTIVADDEEFVGEDLRSGSCSIDTPPPLAEMLDTLITFASACGESYRSGGENANLFVAPLPSVLSHYQDELTIAALDMTGGGE